MQNNCPGIIRLLPVCMIASLFVACNNQDKATIEQADTAAAPVVNQLVFDKLVGTWQNEDQKSLERWVKNDDGSYQVTGFAVKGKDTIVSEQAKVYPDGGKWIFDNLVTGQNEGKSVRFTSSVLTGNSVQFSNPAHDFPSDIHYTVSGDTVRAFIVGKNQTGGLDTIPFNFSRFK